MSAAEEQFAVGPATVAAGLRALGYEVDETVPQPLQGNALLRISYRILLGSRAGETCTVGFIAPPDFPASAPGGIYVFPALRPLSSDSVLPHGGVSDVSAQFGEEGSQCSEQAARCMGREYSQRQGVDGARPAALRFRRVLRYVAAMTDNVDQVLREHLDRRDGQEDVCFALWRPSRGSETTTALIGDPIIPLDDERQVHGNASFMGKYLARAAKIAADANAGLALLHSHPSGRGWQNMSRDDLNAERGSAARVARNDGVADRRADAAQLRTAPGARVSGEECAPHVGSMRLRDREGRRTSVATHLSSGAPSGPRFPRGADAHGLGVGEQPQSDLARLRVGIVGLGSVGSIVAEALARMGVEHIRLIDFDAIEVLNLDRVLHATAEDARLGRAKVHVSERALRQSATAASSRVDAFEWSVVEEEGFRVALDCDVLFSCVDRPWPRAALNLIAYAHFVPSSMAESSSRGRAAEGCAAQTGAPTSPRPAAGASSVSDSTTQVWCRASARVRFDDPDYIAHLGDKDPLPAKRERLRLQHRLRRARDRTVSIDDRCAGWHRKLLAPRCTTPPLDRSSVMSAVVSPGVCTRGRGSAREMSLVSR